MHKMARDEWLPYLLTGTRTGKLATVRADGSPHVVPVWFLVDTAGDGDHVVFTTGKTSVKGRALARDPRFSLCVDVDVAPYSFVTVSGSVVLSDDLDDMLGWATRIGGRYMGEDNAERFGKRNAVDTEWLVRGRIDKVVAHAYVAD
ncbi:PPOX class F420-dependent oxidoreductase [Actinokineospora soli]